MKRLNDPRLQRLLGYVAHDYAIPAAAQQQIQSDLMAIDADLTAAREQAEKAKPSKGAK
jgi:hypothetical protein